jgi:hypothetical protein
MSVVVAVDEEDILIALKRVVGSERSLSGMFL